MADPKAQIPVILGRPFLATSNALINCRNGVMKLSFGNMTIELNIFNACKQMRDDGPDFEEIDMIEAIVQESLAEFADPNSLCPFESDLPNSLNIEDDIVQMASSVWNPKNEELVPSGSKSLPSQVRPPKPELKPLPIDLK